MKKALVVLLFMALSTGGAYAGNVDTYGIGAKATALGGAFAAQADNVFAVHYNPAGLMQLKSGAVEAGLTMLDPKLTTRGYTVSANQALGTGQQGPANATACACDDSDLIRKNIHDGPSCPGFLFACQLSIADTVFSRLARSATFKTCAFRSIRFMNPVRAVPGPNSMNRVNPSLSR